MNRRNIRNGSTLNGTRKTDQGDLFPPQKKPGEIDWTMKLHGFPVGGETMARRTDPETSHEAAKEFKDSGHLGETQKTFMDAVRDYPGDTIREIVQKCIDPEGYAEWRENEPEEYQEWLYSQRNEED